MPNRKLKTKTGYAWQSQAKHAPKDKRRIQEKASRYTKNKVLFSVPCAYARESLIVHLLPPYARESLIVHLSPPYARESLIVHLSPPYACECSRSTNGSAIHSTAGPASSGFVSGHKSSSPETEIRVPSRFHPPESRGNRHFFGKTSRLFRENFLFIGKNGVYYSFTHTILRST